MVEAVRRALFAALALLVSCAHARPPVAPRREPIVVRGEISPETARAFAGELREARAAGATEVEILINSPGGYLQSSIAMYRALLASGLHSRCEVRGFAASGAFLLLQGCERRAMTWTSTLITHRPYIKVPVSGGAFFVTVETASTMANELSGASLDFDIPISRRLGMSLSSYLHRVGNGHNWEMDARDAVLNGAVDEVID